MPSAPLRFCLGSPQRPRCSNRVVSGRCPECRAAQERLAGTRHERGYDSAWVKLRNWFMAQPENQLCAECRAEGRRTLATDADHIIPFDGVDDLKRLDVTNLRPSCRMHNSRRVRRGGGGVKIAANPGPRDAHRPEFTHCQQMKSGF